MDLSTRPPLPSQNGKFPFLLTLKRKLEPFLRFAFHLQPQNLNFTLFATAKPINLICNSHLFFLLSAKPIITTTNQYFYLQPQTDSLSQFNKSVLNIFSPKPKQDKTTTDNRV